MLLVYRNKHTAKAALRRSVDYGSASWRRSFGPRSPSAIWDGRGWAGASASTAENTYQYTRDATAVAAAAAADAYYYDDR